MFTQCVHYVYATIFQKVTKTLDFAKAVNFHQNWKCWKNGCVTISTKTLQSLFKKHRIYINVYKNSRRKTLRLYSFYTIVLHYFLLKMTKITDFVKMSNFHQNYKFPRNVCLPFGEKWVCQCFVKNHVIIIWKTVNVY